MQQDTKTNSTPLPQRAVALAATLLATAKAAQTEGEHDYAQKIARMMDDPRGKALTIALSDQAFRSHRPARVRATPQRQSRHEKLAPMRPAAMQPAHRREEHEPEDEAGCCGGVESERGHEPRQLQPTQPQQRSACTRYTHMPEMAG